MTTLGEAIREARMARDWSQIELARRVGVSQPAVSVWERNRAVPNETLRKRLDELLGGLSVATPTVVPEGSESSEPDEDEERIEGLELAGQSGFGEYPIDSLMIRTDSRSVHEVLRRIEKGQMVLTPDFQRDFVWSELQQSRLIESVLMRIPLPVMYLAENADGKLVVVDGLQRLTTFWRFVNNDLALTLDQSELKGRRFRDLDMRLQNRIEDTSLTLYVIDAKVQERVRLDIFERVNNGAPLTRQQMRNCIYNGPGTRWLRDRATSAEFARLFTKKHLDDLRKAMRDREIINRYAAFRLLGWQSYRGDMDGFLSDSLKKLNAASDTERDNLAKEFDRSIVNSIALFDRMAFRRHEEYQTRGTRFNVALFDVMSTFLGRYEQDRVEDGREPLRKAFYALMKDDRFWNSVAYGTNQRDRVQIRFEGISRAFEEVLGDP